MKADVRPALLSARGLGVQIGAQRVVTGLQLQLAPGEMVAILGRNGAGKTTLLHTLAGLRAPALGTVELGGRPYAAWRHGHEARLRGLLAQSQPDFFSATVLETALVGRHPYLGRWDWEGPQDEAIARAALAAMGLADFASRQVLALSGGERQRLAIAALLTQRPGVYLLDEPLAHLDLHHQIGVLEHFRRLAAEGAAVAMVIHDLNLAARYVSHALLLDGQGGHAFGPAASILTAPRLSAAFGHPLRAIRDGAATLFVPE